VDGLGQAWRTGPGMDRRVGDWKGTAGTGKADEAKQDRAWIGAVWTGMADAERQGLAKLGLARRTNHGE